MSVQRRHRGRRRSADRSALPDLAGRLLRHRLPHRRPRGTALRRAVLHRHPRRYRIADAPGVRRDGRHRGTSACAGRRHSMPEPALAEMTSSSRYRRRSPRVIRPKLISALPRGRTVVAGQVRRACRQVERAAQDDALLPDRRAVAGVLPQPRVISRRLRPAAPAATAGEPAVTITAPPGTDPACRVSRSRSASRPGPSARRPARRAGTPDRAGAPDHELD